MTEPFDEYGERLRRVLNAEADAVVPSPEGLEKIRSKIDERRERRFGLLFALPWLRPLAAVGAAVLVAVIAVSATPALKTFVQTGRFSPPEHQDQTPAVIGGQRTEIRGPAGGSPRLGPLPSSRPTTLPTTTPGAHTGRTCPAGQTPVTAGGDGTASPGPEPTCEDGTSTIIHTPPRVTSPTPVEPTPDQPTEQPTGDAGGGAQPSAQSSP